MACYELVMGDVHNWMLECIFYFIPLHYNYWNNLVWEHFFYANSRAIVKVIIFYPFFDVFHVEAYASKEIFSQMSLAVICSAKNIGYCWVDLLIIKFFLDDFSAN